MSIKKNNVISLLLDKNASAMGHSGLAVLGKTAYENILDVAGMSKEAKDAAKHPLAVVAATEAFLGIVNSVNHEEGGYVASALSAFAVQGVVDAVSDATIGSIREFFTNNVKPDGDTPIEGQVAVTRKMLVEGKAIQAAFNTAQGGEAEAVLDIDPKTEVKEPAKTTPVSAPQAKPAGEYKPKSHKELRKTSNGRFLCPVLGEGEGNGFKQNDFLQCQVKGPWDKVFVSKPANKRLIAEAVEADRAAKEAEEAEKNKAKLVQAQSDYEAMKPQIEAMERKLEKINKNPDYDEEEKKAMCEGIRKANKNLLDSAAQGLKEIEELKKKLGIADNAKPSAASAMDKAMKL